MKIKYSQPKGKRINSQFYCIYTNLWWIENIRKWIDLKEDHDYIKFPAQNFCSCKTVKAFKRHLKKHPEIRGAATLINKYSDYDIRG